MEKISSRGAKDILVKIIETGEDPKIIAKREGLFQKVMKRSLLRWRTKITLGKSKCEVLEHQNGKNSALQLLIGQSMKATGGSG